MDGLEKLTQKIQKLESRLAHIEKHLAAFICSRPCQPARIYPRKNNACEARRAGEEQVGHHACPV